MGFTGSSSTVYNLSIRLRRGPWTVVVCVHDQRQKVAVEVENAKGYPQQLKEVGCNASADSAV